MRFAVIYEVNTSDYDVAENYAPPVDLDFEKTEDDDNFVTPDERPSWKEGSHGKWGGNLSEEQFAEFVEALELSTNGEEGTSLGAIGLGFTNALVFQGRDDEDVIYEAWVTPYSDDPQEIIAWLQKHRQHVPAVLADSPGQRYLIRGVKDTRKTWTAVAQTLQKLYG